MNENVKTRPFRVVELYHLDFHQRSIAPTLLLGANERIVTVELGARLPLRVWVEREIK